MQIIETQRLNIRELDASDAAFILALVNSPGWLQYIGDRNIKDIHAAVNYINNGPLASYHKNGFGLYLVALKGNKVSIGMCGFLKRDTLPNPDIGFALLPQYTGNGYALEAAVALLAYAGNVLKLEKILAITLEKNLRSVQLLTKLGLVFEKKVILAHNEKELMLFGTH